MRRILSAILLLAVCVAAAAAGSRRVRAQQAGAPPDVLNALLIEVRGLRVATEQMASTAPRIQLILGRLQLQEQRIMNQGRRLDTVRAGLAQAQKELDAMADQIRGMSESIHTGAPDLETVRARETELKFLKGQLTSRSTEVQRLQAEEAQLVQEITAEQTRWTDFNQRLDELEGLLQRR